MDNQKINLSIELKSGVSSGIIVLLNNERGEKTCQKNQKKEQLAKEVPEN